MPFLVEKGFAREKNEGETEAEGEIVLNDGQLGSALVIPSENGIDFE